MKKIILAIILSSFLSAIAVAEDKAMHNSDPDGSLMSKKHMMNSNPESSLMSKKHMMNSNPNSSRSGSEAPKTKKYKVVPYKK